MKRHDIFFLFFLRLGSAFTLPYPFSHTNSQTHMHEAQWTSQLYNLKINKTFAASFYFGLLIVVIIGTISSNSIIFFDWHTTRITTQRTFNRCVARYNQKRIQWRTENNMYSIRISNEIEALNQCRKCLFSWIISVAASWTKRTKKWMTTTTIHIRHTHTKNKK